MGLLSRLLKREPHDPYWDGFINRAPVGEDNELAHALRRASEGAVFPVKSELPPPERLSHDLAELAQFLGASGLGVAAVDASLLTEEGADAGNRNGPSSVDGLVAAYKFLIVCPVHAEYDPAKAEGIGGQLPVRESISVNFSLSAYIRELGYEATVRTVKAVETAVAAGLGTTSGGKLHMPEHGTHVYVGEAVLTDIPLVPGTPKL